MTKEIELKKAWNLIIDYCKNTDCQNCMFDNFCIMEEPMCCSKKIEISNEK